MKIPKIQRSSFFRVFLSLLKLSVATLASVCVASVIFAQPASPPVSTPVAPTPITVSANDNSPKWEIIIPATLTGVGALVAALYNGRNSQMTLQTQQIESERKQLKEDQRALHDQTMQRIEDLKREVQEQKENEKQLLAKVDRFDDEADRLTRENFQLQAKITTLESENSTLKLLLGQEQQSKQIQAKVDINQPPG